jgi:Uma2 family endonuclease
MSNAPYQAQDWPLVLRCSPEEARRIAEAAPFRYEYAHGVLRAMAGGTLAHSRLIISLLSALAAHLGDGPCHVFDGNVELHISRDEYRLPDAFVYWDDLQDAYATRLFDARLVCEVLSPSTAEIDRTTKLDEYRTLPGLVEYLLLDSVRQRADLYRRVGDVWSHTTILADSELQLESIAFHVPLARLYAGTGVPRESEP